MKVICLVVAVVNIWIICEAKKDDVLELIRESGYSGEVHQVETEDGYWLKVHRITPTNGTQSKQSFSKHPVFLMHGLFAASADYVVMGRKSLAYLLADNGYDVWLGNARGNKHSTKHKMFSPNSRKFWNFGWHEIGKFDLPAMIDYVLNKTLKRKMFYVGHSQGCTALLVLLSSRPKYNEKIIEGHLMAPAAFISHSPHPLGRLFAREVKAGLLRDFKYLDLSSVWDVGKDFSSIFCTTNFRTTLALCRSVIFIIVGPNRQGVEIDDGILKTLVQHISPKISVMQITHYLQLLLSGRFEAYDYQWENYVRYNSTKPPNYNLQNVVAPMHLYYGSDDMLVSTTDVEHLSDVLPNVVENRIIFNYNHIDFCYGRNSRKLLYFDILNSFERANKNV